ncbi:MAG: RsmD family RNA methyltransferase [Patescibacteria group bacterium]
MSRITSGTAKGKNLIVPNIENIRLPQDKFKLALFSILADKVKGADCLDLYAGSGSLGLDALSRGAQSCDFVDTDRKAIDAIEKNMFDLGFTGRGEIIQDDAVKYVANTSVTYDIIFADPFFDDVKHRFLMQNMEEILNPNGVICFSHGKELDIEDVIKNTKLEIFTTRKYNNAFLTILKATATS